MLATAAERALGWRDGDFLAAYAANQRDSTAITLDADLVAQTVVRFMKDRSEWSGPAKELLEQLRRLVADEERNSKAWPGAPHVLSARLRRAAPMLRDLGIEVDPDSSEGRGQDRRRLIVLRTARQTWGRSESDVASPLPEPDPRGGDAGDAGDASHPEES